MRLEKKYRIGILGLGQMGGSLAMALRKGIPSWPISGYDTDRSLLRWADKKKIIDSKAGSAGGLIADSDIVLLALPISAIIETLSCFGKSLSAKSLVADLGSVRHSINNISIALKLKNHIGIHPMCGTELRGRLAWNEKIFDKASLFVFSVKSADKKAVALSRMIVKAVGGRYVSADIKTHDLALAVTSGIPHILAYSLNSVRKNLMDIPAEFLGPGFAGVTRVSASDPNMVGQILHHNRGNILKAISKFEKQVGKLKKTMLLSDHRKLVSLLENYGNAN